MMCCICKQKEAKVHYTKIEGDKMQKADMCEECARTNGVDDQAAFSLTDVLLGLGGSQEADQPAASAELRCSHCGFTHADFKKAGKLGCAFCYNTFAEILESPLKSMHRGTRHVGKIPASLRQARDLSDRLRTLEKRLKKAVLDEDFEEAAILRDEIKQTTARMSDSAA